MFPELDIDLLRTFVAVVESGSFTKASRAVFRSQAAVSMQVKRLEESIGILEILNWARLAKPCFRMRGGC